MRPRYILSPEAALDLVQIWRHIHKNADLETADRVETVIRQKSLYLANTPGGGHWRKDLTAAPVSSTNRNPNPYKLLPSSTPRRDVEQILKTRT